MGRMLKKELKLSTSPMTFVFIAFAFVTFIPSYPILMSAFFICLGIFQSFHQTRATNDILYSALLPMKKGDVVGSKYIMVCFFQVLGFVLCLIFAMIRMTALADDPAYAQNYLMSANLVFLGAVLIIYLIFNCVFVAGFFKTGYYINKPYILFIIVVLVIIFALEAFHFAPGLEFLNENTLRADAGTAMKQAAVFIACAAAYIIGTLLAVKTAKKRFEMIDL